MEKLPQFSLKKFYWKDFLTIFLGSFMYALGVTMFIMPHKFVLGGLTGVAVLLNYGFGLPVSLMVLIMNALLLTISYKVLGTEFLIKTVISVVSLTVFFGFFDSLLFIPILTEELLMPVFLVVIVPGLGLGLVLLLK